MTNVEKFGLRLPMYSLSFIEMLMVSEIITDEIGSAESYNPLREKYWTNLGGYFYYYIPICESKFYPNEQLSIWCQISA